MNLVRLSTFAALALFTVAGCGSSSDDATTTTSSSASGASSSSSSMQEYPQFAQCDKGTIESDMQTLAPLMGPSVDGGALKKGSYVVATTYLAAKPDQVNTVFMLSSPIIASLSTQKGFEGVSFAQSKSCASLRTLTVWDSEEDMMAFVGSSAHASAMQHIGEVSRGTSNTTDWESDGSDATFDTAAKKLAADGQLGI